MAFQPVYLGAAPNDDTGDKPRIAGAKINDNFTELYSATVAPPSVKTSSYTLVLADGLPGASIIEMDVAGANNVTVPPDSSVDFPIGTVIEICQVGAGATTIAAGVGVTLRPADATLRAQWSTVSLRKRAANEWVLTGDVA